jgi:hypothetical protein
VIRLLVLLILGLLMTGCDPDVTPSPSPTIVTGRTTPTQPVESASNTPTELPTRVATLVPQPSATPSPFRFSSVDATPTLACPDAPPTRLILHERGRVSDEDERSSFLRTSPGTQNDDVLSLAVGSIFLVLDGPVCEGGYAWFLIRYRRTEGWIAEGEPGLYYVEPYLPG